MVRFTAGFPPAAALSAPSLSEIVESSSEEGSSEKCPRLRAARKLGLATGLPFGRELDGGEGGGDGDREGEREMALAAAEADA